MIDTCTDCGEQRVITLKFKAAAQIEVNGVKSSRMVDVALCRGCMRKRAAVKPHQQK